MDWGRRCANISPNQVTKNSSQDSETIVTICNFYNKNYLNLSYAKINSPTKSRECFALLAGANIIFSRLILKKRISNYECPAFLTSTVILSSIITFQCNESPCSNSNNFKISCGITDLTELGPPLLNFVVYSKIGIPPFLLFLYYILYSLRYIYLPFRIIIKGNYNNLYIVGGP